MALKGRVVVEVSGGEVQDHHLIHCAVDVEVLDWDNVKDDPAVTWARILVLFGIGQGHGVSTATKHSGRIISGFASAVTRFGTIIRAISRRAKDALSVTVR